MKKSRGPQTIRPPGATYEVRVVGARSTPLKDFYHLLLRRSWAFTFGVIASSFVTVNAIFACGYLLTGGIAHARSGSFVDAFFFSVQTFGTIGFGALYPESNASNALVVLESIVSLTLTALATGLVFAKFSRPNARLVFTRQAVIFPMNGVPTLSFRLGNERGNRIVDAQIRVSMVRTEHNEEGGTFYRMIDLKLTRDRALSLTRSWTVQHIIDQASPLYGMTPETFERDEVELSVLVVGMDDTTMQPVHAGHQFFTHQVRWGARHVDVLTELADETVELDLRKFHDVEPTKPTETFPYPSSP